MITTIPYIIHYNIIYKDKSIYIPDPDRDTKFWTYFLKIHIVFSVTFHTISVWLTVYLSCFRFFYLRSLFPVSVTLTISKRLHCIVNKIQSLAQLVFLKYKRIIIGILIIYVFGVIFCSPVYFYSTVKEDFYVSNHTNSDLESSSKYYYLDQSELNVNINDLMFYFMLYGQAIFSKLLPCLLILLFTILTVHKLVIKNRNQNELFRRRDTSLFVAEELSYKKFNFGKLCSCFDGLFKKESIPSRGSTSSRIQLMEMDRRETKASCYSEFYPINKFNKNFQDYVANSSKRKLAKSNHTRSTFMLVIVCSLFLLVEFPITILTLLSISMDDNFNNNIYVPLVELMDLSILIYTSINLVLYCSMSGAFRKALYELLSDILYRFIILFNYLVKKFKNYEDY